MNDFSPRDLAQLAELQIDAGRAADQLTRLRAGQVATRLERPCTPGDGILRLHPEEHAALEKAFTAAVAAGRLQRFVPASGAASRMFSQLHADAALLEAIDTIAPAI